MKKVFNYLGCAFIAIFSTSHVLANNISASEKATAPDSTASGPHPTTSAEYRLPASVDADILSDRKTEVWAKVFYPTDSFKSSIPVPLIVMLHGNHATCGTGSNPRSDTNCEYTESGTCPTGYVPVPNHEGYDYLAKNLASWGFVVASINANRGITCGWGASGDWGLNLARGRLVLKHLSMLQRWSTVGGAPSSLGLGSKGLVGKLDFSSVGLFGHSRGGEGVRAAYNLYLDKDSEWPQKIPGLHIKAIFEVGAVDGQTSRVLDANGTVWNQLLPMCDGDVSNLQGRYPFDRMMLNASENPDAQKSLYEVWGANHNFFNTEWQHSDSYGCSAGIPIFDANGSYSTEQQQIALASVPAFFRSRLGVDAKPAFNQNFNPLVSLPDVVTNTTQVDRDFTPSPNASESMIFDDFDKETGVNSSGYQNISKQINISHTKLLSQKVQRSATISWHEAGQETYFEAVWAGAGEGKDIHDFATLDFRIGRNLYDAHNENADFDIALVDAIGMVSKAVRVSDYAMVNGPGTDNRVLKTVRIPLSHFQGVDLTKIHSVRFVFNKTKSDTIYLANIRIHKQLGYGVDGNPALSKALRSRIALMNKPVPVEYVMEALNSIRSVRIAHKSAAMFGKPGVEITVASQVPFPAMNSLPMLHIGGKTFKLSRYADTAQLKELTFTLTEEEFKTLPRDGEVTVSDGKVWKFGNIAKVLK